MLATRCTGQCCEPSYYYTVQLPFAFRIQFEVDQFWAQLDASEDASNLEAQDARIPAGKDSAYLKPRNVCAVGLQIVSDVNLVNLR